MVLRKASASILSPVIEQIRLLIILLAAALTAVSMVGHASANPRYAAYVLDANTGEVLFARNADARRYPASLTKMMTVYMIFEAIEAGRITTNTRIPFSANAASEPPTKLGVKSGGSITVETAIRALITRSANDVSTAVAEFLGGSEASFARMMTAKAKQLGMNSTQFRNAHGLPNSQQYTTARDMAILGVALREHFPRRYDYFSTRSFVYGKQRISTHNRMFGRIKGVDGIKTGYTRASGFNLVTSVRADGRNVVAVVMGGKTGRSRDDHMAALLRDHLPKASRKANGPLIASRRLTPGTAVAAAAISLPRTNIPMPAFRPTTTSIEVAAVNAYAPTPAAAPAVPMPDHDIPVPSAVIAVAPVPSAPIPAAPVPVAAVPSAPAPSASVPIPTSLDDRFSSTGDAAIDPMQTASTRPSGWAVQIASSPSQKDAFAALVRTGKEAAGILESANAFIEEFENKGTVYYRARFGFTSKDQAWNACNALKKQKIDCFASQL